MGVEELIYCSEADIKQLGVKNSAHRARIVSSLVALRDKSEHKGKFEIGFYFIKYWNLSLIQFNCNIKYHPAHWDYY